MPAPRFAGKPRCGSGRHGPTLPVNSLNKRVPRHNPYCQSDIRRFATQGYLGGDRLVFSLQLESLQFGGAGLSCRRVTENRTQR